MELKDICCDLEHSKRLKEAGFPQDSLFYWTWTKDKPNHKNGITPTKQLIRIYTDNMNKPKFASPTAREILKELPGWIKDHRLYIWKERDMTCLNYQIANTEKGLEKKLDARKFGDKKFCHALCDMFYYLAENKLLNGGWYYVMPKKKKSISGKR